MYQDYALYSALPDYLQKSYAGQLIRYQPNGMSPMFLMTSMLGDGTALSVEHGYMTKTLVFPTMTLTAAVADGVADTFTVASTANILPGDIFRAGTTHEVIRVATVASGTSITVNRGLGQIAAAAIANGTILYGIGNAQKQGSTRPASRLMNPVRVMNNTQIFRNSWALPGTMDAIMPIVGGSLSAESKEDCAFFHAADIEKTMIFGQKSGQVIEGQYLTTMDGIVEQVRRLAPAGNTVTAGATTNYNQLNAMLDPGLNTIVVGRHSADRVIFTGGTGIRVFNEIGRLSGQYQIMDGQSQFGFRFSTFKLPRATYRLIEHPIFNTNPVWSAMAVSVHLESLKLMYLKGRKTSNQEYGTTGTPVDNGVDAVGGTLTTELTMENINPSAHTVIYGLTAGAA